MTVLPTLCDRVLRFVAILITFIPFSALIIFGWLNYENCPDDRLLPIWCIAHGAFACVLTLCMLANYVGLTKTCCGDVYVAIPVFVAALTISHGIGGVIVFERDTIMEDDDCVGRSWSLAFIFYFIGMSVFYIFIFGCSCFRCVENRKKKKKKDQMTSTTAMATFTEP